MRSLLTIKTPSPEDAERHGLVSVRKFDKTLSPEGVSALESVLLERVNQDLKWGDQSHHSEGDWLLILQEEIGEWSQAVLDARFKSADPKLIREELVQVAAVALSMLECLDRNNESTTP